MNGEEGLSLFQQKLVQGVADGVTHDVAALLGIVGIFANAVTADFQQVTTLGGGGA